MRWTRSWMIADPTAPSTPLRHCARLVRRRRQSRPLSRKRFFADQSLFQQKKRSKMLTVVFISLFSQYVCVTAFRFSVFGGFLNCWEFLVTHSCWHGGGGNLFWISHLFSKKNSPTECPIVSFVNVLKASSPCFLLLHASFFFFFTVFRFLCCFWMLLRCDFGWLFVKSLHFSYNTDNKTIPLNGNSDYILHMFR